MSEESHRLLDVLSSAGWNGLLRSGLLLVVGLLVARLLSSAVGRIVQRRANAQAAMLARRSVGWTLAALVLATTLVQLGFKLGVLVGAAGVLTVALGFAAQTAASNVISGLFLVGERPFVLGDWVEVDGVLGVVSSIDLISVKVRTFDNRLVRIPNETLLKSKITNLSYFAIRRLEIPIGVAYREDVNRVRSLLLELVREHPLCLDEPEPLVRFTGFGDSALELLLLVWVAHENILEMGSELRQGIKERLDAAGIEIPFPQRSVWSAPGSAALPVRLVSAGERDPES
jgi:small-conductance mechanosensitive channel